MSRTRNVDAAGSRNKKASVPTAIRACPPTPLTRTFVIAANQTAQKKKSGNTSRAGVTKTAVTWEANSQG